VNVLVTSILNWVGEMRKTIESNHLQLPNGGSEQHPDSVSKEHRKGNELLGRENTCYKDKSLFLVKTTMEGALLYTFRIEELGRTTCAFLNSALIHHPGFRNVQMIGMSGIAPRSADQQPETFIHINDTTPPEVVSEAGQSPRMWRQDHICCICHKIN